jgi:hypothetical protein
MQKIFRFRLCFGIIFLFVLQQNFNYKIHETKKNVDYLTKFLLTKESNKSYQLSKVKILLYIATHMSKMHMWYLKNCWPTAMRNSLLLNMSDVTIYLNKSEENKTTAIELLKNVFNGRNLIIHTPNETGDPSFDLLSNNLRMNKQNGAIRALGDAFDDGLFSGYDWVIRVNPDVIIRNETQILDIILYDQTATAIIVDCSVYKRKTKPSLPILVHTDFFVLRTRDLPRDIFKNHYGLSNAEAIFTKQIEDRILRQGRHRLMENLAPLSRKCRVGDRRSLDSIPVTHFHPLPKTMSINSCPLKF